MTIELDTLVVTLRADSRALQKDLDAAAGQLQALEGLARAPQAALADTALRAQQMNESLSQTTSTVFEGLNSALSKFLETGRLTFSDLRSIALSALEGIAQSIFSQFGLGGAGGGGIFGSLFNSAFSFLTGRASGGPVSPQSPVVVGERGPELFVPRTAGQVMSNAALNQPMASGRPVNITVNVNGRGDADSLRQSGTQVALAVRRALRNADRFA